MRSLRIAAALACLSAGAGACAGSPAGAGETLVRARLGETVRAGSTTIRPLALLEDSRCPADAVCVHAGTVRMRAEIRVPGRTPAGRPASADVNTGVALGDVVWFDPRIQLVAVCPYPLASQPAPPSRYTFVFSVGATETPPRTDRDLC